MPTKLVENIQAFIDQILGMKPSAVKGSTSKRRHQRHDEPQRAAGRLSTVRSASIVHVVRHRQQSRPQLATGNSMP